MTAVGATGLGGGTLAMDFGTVGTTGAMTLGDV